MMDKKDSGKKLDLRPEFFIAIFALAIGIYYEWPALSNFYVIDGDVRSHIYWMYLFQDPALFPDDFLTEYAKSRQPWGLTAVYYLFSFFFDPVLFSKALVLPVFMLGACYAFKLGRHAAGAGTGFLAAVLFIMNPTFFRPMTGGLSRTFAYPLMLMFLYYMVKKDYLKTALCMILGCLFYPVVFFLSFFTYLFSFVGIESRRLRVRLERKKVAGLVAGTVLGMAVLAAQHVLLKDPNLGTLFTREQMIGHPEFYKGKGRHPIFPTQPVLEAVLEMAPQGVLNDRPEKDAVIGVPVIYTMKGLTVLFWAAVLAAAVAALRHKWFYPPELIGLLSAGILMYVLADIFLLKLFLPERYLRYSLHIASFLLFAFFLGFLVQKIRALPVRRWAYGAIAAVLIFFHMSIVTNWDYVDHSTSKGLYTYLSGLPKDVMIAAHPQTADGIATFAKRKVFMKRELSAPLYTLIWKEFKRRTYALLDAYYAGDFESILEFCEANGVHYLIVDETHFTDRFIRKKRIYFEPFNTDMKQKIGSRRDFALMRIPEDKLLFRDGTVFVVHKSALRESASA